MNKKLGFSLNAEGYQRLRRELTQNERKLISKVFYACDNDFKGYLTREDIKVAFVELFGFKPCKSEVDSLISSYANKDENKEKIQPGLTLDEFTSAMASKMTEQDEDEVIRETFLAFDTHYNVQRIFGELKEYLGREQERSGTQSSRGFLRKDDVERVFSKVAPHLPPVTVDTAFREIDQDGDGRVSFRDFQMMMKYDFDCHI